MTEAQVSLDLIVDAAVEPRYEIIDVDRLPEDSALIGPKPEPGFIKNVREAGRVLVPVILEERLAEGTYRVIDGIRRIKSVRKIRGLSTVPAMIYPEGKVTDGATVSTNQQRSNNAAAEYDAVVRMMRDHGLAPREIAVKLGIKQARIAALMNLANLSEGLLGAFNEGRLKETAAIALSKLPKDVQEFALKELDSTGKMTVGRAGELKAKDASTQAAKAGDDVFDGTEGAKLEFEWPVTIGPTEFKSEADLLSKLTVNKPATDANGKSIIVHFVIGGVQVLKGE